MAVAGSKEDQPSSPRLSPVGRSLYVSGERLRLIPRGLVSGVIVVAGLRFVRAPIPELRISMIIAAIIVASISHHEMSSRLARICRAIAVICSELALFGIGLGEFLPYLMTEPLD